MVDEGMEVKATVERPDSCKISINAKDQMSGEVKVYAEHVEDAMIKALEKAKELSDKIKQHNGL